MLRQPVQWSPITVYPSPLLVGVRPVNSSAPWPEDIFSVEVPLSDPLLDPTPSPPSSNL